MFRQNCILCTLIEINSLPHTIKHLFNLKKNYVEVYLCYFINVFKTEHTQKKSTLKTTTLMIVYVVEKLILLCL